MTLRCPFLVGRGSEVATIAAAMDSSAGSVMLVSGEAGVGKTRLVREAAALAKARRRPVLAARASDSGVTEPFRPLAELVIAGLTRIPPSAEQQLDGYRPVLATLAPVPGTTPAPDASLAVIAEGVRRLLDAVAGVALLEDLHWADPDTLAVVDYLADHMPETGAILLATLRADEANPAATLARALAARGAATIIELRRLDATQAALMAAGCLGLHTGASAPPGVLALVGDSADGLPLLVEDLLASAYRDGSLVDTPAGWTVTPSVADAQPPVPLTFVDTVRRRLARLSSTDVRVLHAAAVFGRSFPWAVLGEVAELDEPTVLDGLRHAIAAGLVVTDGDGFTFRHALTAAAVLDEVLGPERMRLSRRAADALAAAEPDEASIRVADLRVAAGQPDEAAAVLLAVGTRALADVAVAAARASLERAVRLAGRPELAAAARQELLATAAASGDSALAVQVGTEILETAPDGSADPVNVHLLVARACVGGDPAAAARHLAAARANAAGDQVACARVDALDALAVLESDRADRLELAEQLARRAAATAEAAALHDVACEAFEVIGRCARVRDLDAAEAAFSRQLQRAKVGELPLWRIRALNELGTISWLRAGNPDGVRVARDAALKAGAVLLAAGYSINVAAFAAFLGRFDEALSEARRTERTARRLGADGLAAAAVVVQVVVAALRGRRAEFSAELARLPGADRGDAAAHVVGFGETMLALLEEDRAAALDACLRADVAQRRMAATQGDSFSGLWLLIRLVDGEASAADLQLVERHAPGTVLHTAMGGFARAVLAGRAGDADAATAEIETGLAAAAPMPVHRFVCLRLVAEAALTDGWGDPAGWLAECETWFRAHGHDRVVAACRGLLRRAGVVVGRSGPAEAAVPPHLRQHGVTAREWEVLVLLGDRLTNREIANRLYLSSRTVEKHVASLFRKLGATSRRDLGRRFSLTG